MFITKDKDGNINSRMFGISQVVCSREKEDGSCQKDWINPATGEREQILHVGRGDEKDEKALIEIKERLKERESRI